MVDPSKITHAYIVVTPQDQERQQSSTLLDAVFDLNKKRNPKLWIYAHVTGAANVVKYLWLCVDAAEDGYPHFELQGVFNALLKLGVDPSASLVMTNVTTTFDGGRTTSKAWVGFSFMEQEPRFLCPDCDNKCIPPGDWIAVESDPGKQTQVWS